MNLKFNNKAIITKKKNIFKYRLQQKLLHLSNDTLYIILYTAKSLT